MQENMGNNHKLDELLNKINEYMIKTGLRCNEIEIVALNSEIVLKPIDKRS
jgi:hypothetical protein